SIASTRASRPWRAARWFAPSWCSREACAMERPTRHPPLQPGWIDSPHLGLDLGSFALESGETIRDFRVSYVVHGLPSEAAAAPGALAGRAVALALCAVASSH